MALAVDPLFFCAPSIGRTTGPACYFIDGAFAAVVTVLRTCIDALHLWHMWLQFRLAYGKLVWDPRAIASHYACSLTGFWFDVIVILPVPRFILNNTDDDAKKIAYEKIKQRVMDAARSIFRPEFMNKVDEYIVFQPLDPDMINSIVRLQKRVADRKMKIGIIDAAVDLLGSLVYDPNYEARLVKRVIQQNIENELTKGNAHFQED
ncbi:P-loop containing nucleoside triphosphate hydrolase protein [Raphanus sativus]|nr:P-loop containing nucleoside triphosphate hydrolase protein [Raphanus sativus]